MLIPLLYFAEKYCNCEVEFDFSWNIHSIYKKQPDIVVLPNTVGSNLFFEASKYANLQGIKVFALISEGNFRTDGSFDFWGYNIDKKFYQEYVCCWSKRSCDFVRQQVPEFKNKIFCTGAIGFDRYSIYNFTSKEEFFKKRNLTQFKKVIGYAGWAFGKLYNKQGLDELLFYFNGDSERLKWAEKQMYDVENILKLAIENNPDILFLLKKHPSEANQSITGYYMNEMNRLAVYPNVLYIVEGENLHDLINISDIWMGFETTTTLEAWLLNKHTILVNPDPNFSRDKTFNGSLIANSYNKLQCYIDEFYTSNKIAEFNSEEKLSFRNQLIEDTIGFSDGFNHIRTGLLFKNMVNEIEKNGINKQRIFSIKYYFKYLLMAIGKYFYIKKIFLKLPKFKKTVWIFENFKLKNIEFLKNKYFKYLDSFHTDNKIKEKLNSPDFVKKILNN